MCFTLIYYLLLEKYFSLLYLGGFSRETGKEAGKLGEDEKGKLDGK